jgi:hypothetical protein
VSAATEAAQYADKVLALIPALVDKAVEERRTHACWWEVYRKRRAMSASTKIAHRWWTWLAGISAAKCSANREMASQCAMASAHVRAQELA